MVSFVASASFLYFNPRSPHGERPPPILNALERALFQSTLPAWGATSFRTVLDTFGNISIHAPRMGSDIAGALRCFIKPHFNPRSPHGERHETAVITAYFYSISIHAPRMGSDLRLCFRLLSHRISIHAPRMGSDMQVKVADANINISIHAPRMGSDFVMFNFSSSGFVFQSTLPAWGAT